MLSLEGIRDARPEPTTTTDGGSQPPPVTPGGTEVGETDTVSTPRDESTTEQPGDEGRSDGESEGRDAAPGGEPGGGVTDGGHSLSTPTSGGQRADDAGGEPGGGELADSGGVPSTADDRSESGQLPPADETGGGTVRRLDRRTTRTVEGEATATTSTEPGEPAAENISESSVDPTTESDEDVEETLTPEAPLDQ